MFLVESIMNAAYILPAATKIQQNSILALMGIERNLQDNKHYILLLLMPKFEKHRS